MENLAINLTGLLTSATGIFAFIFLVLVQHHLDQPARSAFRWIALGVLFGVYSVTRVWLTYAATDVFSGGQVPVQRTYGALIAGALMLIIVIPQLIRLRRIQNATNLRIFIVGQCFTALALGLYLINFFWTIGFTQVVLMSMVAIVGFVLPGYGAYRLRARYPGTTIEALIIAGGLLAVITTVVMMATTNVRAEQAVANNQSSIVAHLIDRQAKQHLTKEAFDPSQAKSKTQLADFVDEVTVPELHRIKVIRADGLVLASDLEKLVGTKVLLTDALAAAARGDASTQLLAPEKLPETERQFGNAQVVTVPITVTPGQTVQGIAQLFLDAPAAMSAIQAFNNAVNFAGIIVIFMTIVVLATLLRFFRRNISHPFAEMLDEVKHIHAEDETGEHRRLKVHHESDFTTIADAFNHLINEYEQRIRDQKKIIDENRWGK